MMKWNIIASTLLLGCLSLSTGSASAADEAGDEAAGMETSTQLRSRRHRGAEREFEGAQDEAQDAVDAVDACRATGRGETRAGGSAFKLKRRALILPAGPLVESVPAD